MIGGAAVIEHVVGAISTWAARSATNYSEAWSAAATEHSATNCTLTAASEAAAKVLDRTI